MRALGQRERLFVVFVPIVWILYYSKWPSWGRGRGPVVLTWILLVKDVLLATELMSKCIQEHKTRV
jgi:hypothetical protein